MTRRSAPRTRHRVLTLVAVAFAVATSGPAAQAPIDLSGVTTRLTANPAAQIDPAIARMIVVYTDSRDGNENIYYRDIDGGEVQVTTSLMPQRLHDVDGTTIVYSDLTPPGPHVRAFDITTKTDLGVISPTAAQNARIDGSVVVYEVGIGGITDVWMTDLSSGVSSPVAATPNVESAPVVSGTRIAYERHVVFGAPGDIVLHDLATGLERTVASGPSDQARPDIDGNVVV